MPIPASLLGRAGAGLVGLTVLLAACSDPPSDPDVVSAPVDGATAPDPLAFAEGTGTTGYTRDQAIADLVAGGIIQIPAAECIVDAVAQTFGLEILNSPDAVTPDEEAALVTITNACLGG